MTNETIKALIEEANETARAIRSQQSVGPNDARRIEALAAALSALSGETEVTTREELESLPDNAVIRDSMGDVGVIWNGFAHYPETNPIALKKVANNYLPARVIHMPEVVRVSTEARDKAAQEYAETLTDVPTDSERLRRYLARLDFKSGWDARGQAIKDDPRIPEVNKAWVFDPVGMKSASDEVRTGVKRARGQVTPDFETREQWFESFYGRHLPMKLVPGVGVPCECGHSEGESYSGHLAREFSAAILALFNEKGNE